MSRNPTPDEVADTLEDVKDAEVGVWVTDDVVTLRLRGDSAGQDRVVSALRSNPDLRVSDLQKYEDWAGQRVVTFNVERPGGWTEPNEIQH